MLRQGARKSFDDRGRVVGATVQIAKPGVPSDTLVSRYANKWYDRYWTFDAANREVEATTGVTNPLLQVSAASSITTSYTQRGTVGSVGSSYGTLVASVTRDADGLVTQIVYGDQLATTTSYTYDQRRWLATQKTERDQEATALWYTTGAQYTPTPNYTSSGTGWENVYQAVLQDDRYTYDLVGNPLKIEDLRDPEQWNVGYRPVDREVTYDSLCRVTKVDYRYKTTYEKGTGADVYNNQWTAPNVDPGSDPRRAPPMPYSSFSKRIDESKYQYDWLGNLVDSRDPTPDDADSDDGFYDRSLGTVTSRASKPYQAAGASLAGLANGKNGNLVVEYDAAGNMVDMAVIRNGGCASGKCSQRFIYDWDEAGRLMRARRWDMDNPGVSVDPATLGAPSADLGYSYDAGDQRVIKQSGDRHTLYIFPTLELRRGAWDDTGASYTFTELSEVGYLIANGMRLARVQYDGNLPGESLHVYLEMGDHLGSTSVVVDKQTSELVQRTTYQAYGAPENDYRPGRWEHYREDYRFTGKEEDIEVGLIYFGKRFLNPLLGRWVSADPLAVHAPGEADLNLYAYVKGQTLRAVDPVGLDGHHSENGPFGHEPDAEETAPMHHDPYLAANPYDEFDEGTTTELEKLDEGARIRAHAVLSKAKQEREEEGVKGVKVKLRIGYRKAMHDPQKPLEESQQSVGGQPPWHSMHQYRIAWDIVIVDSKGNEVDYTKGVGKRELNRLIRIAHRFGVEAGNLAGDGVHFQYTNSSHSRVAEKKAAEGGMSNKEAKKVFEGSNAVVFNRVCGGSMSGCSTVTTPKGPRPNKKPPHPERALRPLATEKKE